MDHDEIDALAWEIMDEEGLPLDVALDEAALTLPDLREWAQGWAGAQACQRRLAIIANHTYAWDWDRRVRATGNDDQRLPLNESE